jgi:hypothetical protein
MRDVSASLPTTTARRTDVEHEATAAAEPVITAGLSFSLLRLALHHTRMLALPSAGHRACSPTISPTGAGKKKEKHIAASDHHHSKVTELRAMGPYPQESNALSTYTKQSSPERHSQPHGTESSAPLSTH